MELAHHISGLSSNQPIECHSAYAF